MLNSHALKLIAPDFTKIVAFEEKILVNAQPPTELYEVFHVVAGKEAATGRILPTTSAYHWRRLKQRFSNISTSENLRTFIASK